MIRDARVFDGEAVLPRASVLIRNGRIAAIGRRVAPPEGATVVDGTGKTLLPGLIDAHAHAYGTALRDALVMGVTTELDMFTDIATADQLRRDEEYGNGEGRADLRTAGTLATAPGGHGTEYGMAIPTIAVPAEAQAFVDARIAEGSDYIKIVYDDGHAYGLSMPTLDRATLTALVEAAHRRGKLAVVHVGDLRSAREALEAGADGLAHLFVDTSPDPGFGKLAASKKAFVIPTLSVLESVAWRDGGAKLAADPRVAPFVLPENERNLKQTFPRREGGPPRSYAAAVAMVRQLEAAGVAILAGTDAPNPGTAHGATIHGEMKLLVEAGLTPTEALRAATSAPAKAFGLDDRGRIAVGKRADLVLVRGDPTSDVGATRDIVAVWKRGVRVDRESYRAEVAEARAQLVKASNAPPPPGSESGLVSDFDGGDAKTQFGAGWSVSTDQIVGGKSTAAMKVVEGGAGGTGGALLVRGTVAGGLPYAWSGVMFSPGELPMAPANLSSKTALRFWARGDGAAYRVMLFSLARGRQPLVRELVAPAEWKEFVFPLKDFEGFDGRDLIGVVIAAGPGPGDFALTLDQVRFE